MKYQLNVGLSHHASVKAGHVLIVAERTDAGTGERIFKIMNGERPSLPVFGASFIETLNNAINVFNRKMETVK